MNAPALIIELGVEATPRVYSTAKTEEEHVRVLDWVNANADRHTLLRIALELRDQAKKAA